MLARQLAFCLLWLSDTFAGLVCNQDIQCHTPFVQLMYVRVLADYWQYLNRWLWQLIRVLGQEGDAQGRQHSIAPPAHSKLQGYCWEQAQLLHA